MRALPCSLALLVLLALPAMHGCASQGPPSDEFDGEVIDELSTDQGSASGITWTGSYASSFTTTSCDCPTLTLDGGSIDVCALVERSEAQLELTQADGFLVVTIAAAMLTGAIEAEGDFVVAGRQDLSTLLGPTELLGRMDGMLELAQGQARLSGNVGQRLIGEFAGEAVDCRWLGKVEAMRID